MLSRLASQLPLGVLLKPVTRTVRAHSFDGGVEGLRCGRFSFGINTCVWSYRIGDVVIDTCSPNMQAHVLQHYTASARVDRVVDHRIESPPCTEHAISHIFISHHHEDHSGNLAALQLLFPFARALAPPASLPHLLNGFHEEYYRRIVWGDFEAYKDQQAPLPLPLEVLPPDRAASLRISDCPYSARMRDGSRVGIVPVASPGHCDDHTVFWVPERSWLFSADAFISESTKIARFDENLADVVRTLRSLIALRPSVLFCGHRGAVGNATQHLVAKLQWLESLQQRVRDLVRGGSSPEQARLLLLGREDFLYYFSMGDFSQMNLLRGLLRDEQGDAKQKAS